MLDVLRIIGGVVLLSCGLSWLVMPEKSLTWGWNPWFLRAGEWKAIMKGPVRLTDAQLLEYDGTDPNKPIYLALNGTIYDVSASRHTYGPGGSYHFFAGHDAARAFITGCFAEDQTPDLRGVEEMYIPIDPPTDSLPSSSAGEAPENPHPTYDPLAPAGRHTPDPAPKPAGQDNDQGKGEKKKPLTKAQLKIRREQEHRQARKKVRETLEGWHVLFRGDKGKPYFKVGEVVREEGWLEKLEPRQLCETARKGRPVRKD